MHDTNALFSSSKGTTVVLGIPGAFTGTCSVQVPAVCTKASAGVGSLAAAGKFQLYIMCANDPAVTKRFAEDLKASSAGATFLSDGNLDFAKEQDLLFDLSVAGLGMRSNRYALIYKDGKLAKKLVEKSPGAKLQETDPDNIIKHAL